MMDEMRVHVGDEATFSKTVSESDVYLFAGLTGDLAPNHVNEEVMRHSRWGRRMVHGALLVGFMSTASTMIAAPTITPDATETPVAAGYDRIRFIAPVFFGDTVSVSYRVVEVDPVKRQAKADVRVTARGGELVAVATSILRWVPNPK
jgi:3-hydroxybutyryl-CoA dehydratase